MKKILMLVLISLLSFHTFAEENKCEQSIFLNGNSQQIVQRGCCSHHGGVCGCSGGRQVCCDGALSPSCLCHAEDIQKFIEQEKENNLEANIPKS